MTQSRKTALRMISSYLASFLRSAVCWSSPSPLCFFLLFSLLDMYYLLTYIDVLTVFPTLSHIRLMNNTLCAIVPFAPSIRVQLHTRARGPSSCGDATLLFLCGWVVQ